VNKMIVYEHTYVIFDVRKGPKVMKETLNTFGEDGWQLCSIINVGGEKLCAFLKRGEAAEIEDKSAEEKTELMNIWSDKNGE
tara:strand:- start:782 stop:1027 length:246 start_codon:yes stop_codon:yes gene_type:complete